MFDIFRIKVLKIILQRKFQCSEFLISPEGIRSTLITITLWFCDGLIDVNRDIFKFFFIKKQEATSPSGGFQAGCE